MTARPGGITSALPTRAERPLVRQPLQVLLRETMQMELQLLQKPVVEQVAAEVEIFSLCAILNHIALTTRQRKLRKMTFLRFDH